MDLFQTHNKDIHKKALDKLKRMFQKKKVTDRKGQEFWATPNFQRTTLTKKTGIKKTRLSNTHILVFREHPGFRRAGQYIVTYQIKTQ